MALGTTWHWKSLLTHMAENQAILYLWQNDHTVVIGKHQNPWKECDCHRLENEGGKLARRLSGGGAVYHDRGNLNFTLVMDRKLYDLDKQLSVLLCAVRDLGIEAQFSGRNDLVAGGKKFSGNAFCLKLQTAYHHGTVLINTDFAKLERYLCPSQEKIASKIIDARSVRSRVVNLASLNPEITVADLSLASPEIQWLYQKYASWQWRYGQSPDFDISYRHRFDWGEVELGFTPPSHRHQ